MGADKVVGTRDERATVTDCPSCGDTHVINDPIHLSNVETREDGRTYHRLGICPTNGDPIPIFDPEEEENPEKRWVFADGKYRWRCPKGHTISAYSYDRSPNIAPAGTHDGEDASIDTGCPVCLHQRVLQLVGPLADMQRVDPRSAGDGL